MTSLEKYKAALSRGEEIINMGLCGFDEQSAKNFTNAYNRAMSVITKAESMTDETLDELWINLDDAANLLSVRDGDIKEKIQPHDSHRHRRHGKLRPKNRHPVF